MEVVEVMLVFLREHPAMHHGRDRSEDIVQVVKVIPPECALERMVEHEEEIVKVVRGHGMRRTVVWPSRQLPTSHTHHTHTTPHPPTDSSRRPRAHDVCDGCEIFEIERGWRGGVWACWVPPRVIEDDAEVAQSIP